VKKRRRGSGVKQSGHSPHCTAKKKETRRPSSLTRRTHALPCEQVRPHAPPPLRLSLPSRERVRVLHAPHRERERDAQTRRAPPPPIGVPLCSGAPPSAGKGGAPLTHTPCPRARTFYEGTLSGSVRTKRTDDTHTLSRTDTDGPFRPSPSSPRPPHDTPNQSRPSKTMATPGPSTDCRMYEPRFPEVDEVVMVQVDNIAEMGAYVHLLEYAGAEGMILLSELSRRRIRSINKLIKVGRQEPVMVLRVDK